ncbi:MAG: V-type ATP synthase subunit D [Oligosphaeraceae bacterium]
MSIINVPPTKTKQLEMKRDLATAMEGYTLLEQKREILVMELMHLLDRVKLVQREVDERRARAYATLRRAMSYNGYHLMRRVAEGIEYEHHVEAHVRIAAGVRIPSLETRHGSFSSQYGLIGTDSLVDQTMADYLALLEALGHLAELESAVWLLARELKKTQRHVNALEHIFIPNYRDTLRFIGQALESKELESFNTMKTVKKRLERANAEGDGNDGDGTAQGADA